MIVLFVSLKAISLIRNAAYSIMGYKFLVVNTTIERIKLYMNLLNAVNKTSFVTIGHSVAIKLYVPLIHCSQFYERSKCSLIITV